MQYKVLTTKKSKNTATEAMWNVWSDYLSKHYNLSIYNDRVVIQIYGRHFESTLEDQIRRVWHFPYSDCDLVKFDDGNIGFVLSVVGEDDTLSFTFSLIPKCFTWEDKLIQVNKLLQSFIDESGLEYDFDNNEYQTKIDIELDIDTLSAIEKLNSDLTFYYGNRKEN